MKLSTMPYKGARDFYPEDKRLQKYIFSVWREVVEGFGYQEYGAPIVEPIDLYASKTSEEIVAEQTFVFLDRGGRTVTLRPEMTPSVSRMVAARRQELSYPLRWYSIPDIWRYERPQRGRLREHWQLNVDLFGVPSMEAEHEIILIAAAVMKAFRAKPDTYEIRVSSRQLVNYLLSDYLPFDQTQAKAVIRLIDHKNKMDSQEFSGFLDVILTPHQHENGVAGKLKELLDVKQLSELPLLVQQHPAVNGIQKLLDTLKASGVKNAVFDSTLVRGFEYYSGFVFEVFDKDPKNSRAMFGGGRFDGLMESFGVESLPAVGFGMGDVVLADFLKTHELLPDLAAETDAAVILIGDVYEEAQEILADFRREGLRLAVDTTARKLDAKIKSAVKSGVPYVMFIGDEELQGERFRLKHLATGKEKVLSFERVVSTLADYRRPQEL